jgi:threonine dehydratase
VDDILLVSEASLRRAIVELLAHEQLVVEGAGAVVVAALLHEAIATGSKKIAAILSGRNIDFSVLHSLIQPKNAEGGRRVYDQAGSAETW